MFNADDRGASRALPIGNAFEQLLAAAKAGGEWAWRELYRQTAPTLARYVRARGAPDPEDVVGETFVRIVQHIHAFVGDETAFRAWVFTIARNRIVDGARSRARRPLELLTDEDLVALTPIGDAEADALTALEGAGVRALLDRLSPDQRDVLLLRILGGLTFAEVATVMGRHEGAVKMLQARGLARLRREISRGAVTL